ncbi:AGE family epimerase/isomerase [Sporolactobacillus pectinivorans]|uniref:AGE family epimerase/isomerase n=1 Tax=Sporolactobacillus pectinivorans TaxID=1591408 RepID=UPI000C25ED44|nr:AGE family epimerase/isomerase [Sporolactobacillus pectinivorans]
MHLSEQEEVFILTGSLDTLLDFFSSEWLRLHILQTVDFYFPRCIDRAGGYFHCYLDDGTVCDELNKSLVGTARFIYIFSTGVLVGGPSVWRSAVEHGLRFLNDGFRDETHGGYYWLLKGRYVPDTGKYAYGHAFVLLALSTAYKAGFTYVRPLIDDIFNLLNQYFRDSVTGLYVDRLSEDWSSVDPYRGQNANMHLCEAMIAAFEATGDRKFLQTAYRLAYTVTVCLTGETYGMIWEQYRWNWQPDWTYHEAYAGNEFRLYGFIPGHSIEWSKLLIKLSDYYSDLWIVNGAQHLFLQAWQAGKDDLYGGLFFSIVPDGSVIDDGKYYWVMAETIGASALLAAKTGDPYFLELYQKMFYYCWSYFIDHIYGGWYAHLDRKNRRTSRIKSGITKTDYHPITNCLEAFRVFGWAKGDRFEFIK